MKRTSSAIQAVACILAAGMFTRRLLKEKRIRRHQVVVITGASSGLGLALAHRFGKAGSRLVLGARSMDDLTRARAELLAAASITREEDILLVPCDVSDKEQAARLIEAALSAFGRMDVLINNAGIIEVGPAENQTIEAYERSMATNFFGAVYTTYAALPYLLNERAGAIVNISSIGGKVAVPHLLPYTASKFALTGFSEGLHAELRDKGVIVTTVCPGLMRTGGEAHAHFVGQAEKERAWFQTSARTPLLSANVNYAADKIFRAVDAGRAEITITPQAWLAARFAGCAPETTAVVNGLISSYLLPSPVAIMESRQLRV